MTPEVAQAPEPTPAGMGVFSRITGVFFEPGKTFEDIGRRPSWFVPLLLSILSGLAFYTGNLFPDWKGNAFVGGLAGTRVERLVFDGDDVVAHEALLMDEGKRIRDVRSGPDGALWLLTDDTGEVLRIVPAD